jgi:hypothetical protein
MSHWSQFATNPQALSIYDNAPGLDKVDFLQCRFTQSGSVFELDLSLNEMPQRRPSRWPSGANAVALTLHLWAVHSSSVSVNRFGDHRQATCSFRKSSNGLLFECSGSGLDIWVECDSMGIAHISGYSLVPHDRRQEYA